jgi:hypothetical protein
VGQTAVLPQSFVFGHPLSHDLVAAGFLVFPPSAKTAVEESMAMASIEKMIFFII